MSLLKQMEVRKMAHRMRLLTVQHLHWTDLRGWQEGQTIGKLNRIRSSRTFQQASSTGCLIRYHQQQRSCRRRCQIWMPMVSLPQAHRCQIASCLSIRWTKRTLRETPRGRNGKASMRSTAALSCRMSMGMLLIFLEHQKLASERKMRSFKG